MQIGISFGSLGGLDEVCGIVLKAVTDLDLFGFLTRPTPSKIEAQGEFDNYPIYAVPHEPIYCQGGVASDWAAERAVSQYPTSTSGDPGLPPIRYTSWVRWYSNTILRSSRSSRNWLRPQIGSHRSELYDIEQLKKNEVPVYSSTYVDDMYIDFRFAQETAGPIRGCKKTYMTNALYHDAPRSRSEEIMKAHFVLKEDSID